MKTTTKNNNKKQFSVTYHTWEDNLEHVWTSTFHFWLTKPKYLRNDYERVGQNLLFEMIILSHYQILPQKSLTLFITCKKEITIDKKMSTVFNLKGYLGHSTTPFHVSLDFKLFEKQRYSPVQKPFSEINGNYLISGYNLLFIKQKWKLLYLL